MTDRPSVSAITPLDQLVEKWRSRADGIPHRTPEMPAHEWALRLCADELEAALLSSDRAVQPEGLAIITSERVRQMAVEGWTAEHDDSHMDGEMIEGARGYLSAAFLAERGRRWNGSPPPTWPWNQSWWKPSDDPIRNLAKAGALIAAEIDRLQRKSGLPIASDRAVQPEAFTENEIKDVLTALYQDGHVDLVLADRIAALMKGCQ